MLLKGQHEKLKLKKHLPFVAVFSSEIFDFFE